MTLFLPPLFLMIFWKQIILNINNVLTDWLDNSFSIWVIQNNFKHFKNLDFKYLYETNAMYPFKYSLSFAEHFFFPSFFVFIISYFIKNPITQYNILILLNHSLIFICSYLLLGIFTKKSLIKLIGSFYLSFSPYFFTQLGHIQMIFFWPYLLTFYFLLKFFEEKQNKYLILSGIVAGLQFLSCVYLGIFLFLSINLFLFFKLIVNKNHDLVKNFIILNFLFFIISSPSIIGYFKLYQEYRPNRDVREFIVYSAHVTDYLFPSPNQDSALYRTGLFKKIKNFNNHIMGEKAAFIGFFPLIIISFYFFSLVKIKKEGNFFNFKIKVGHYFLFFLILAFFGFILSLGPRFQANGAYLHIPLPYYFILKISFASILRALARWYFLVVFSVSILLTISLDNFDSKLKKFNNLLLIFILLLFILEFYPSPLKPQRVSQFFDNNSILTEICKDGQKKLVEYPFTYRNTDGTLIKDLEYKSTILFNSTFHNCKILSGFSAFEPPKYLEIKSEFDNGFDEKDLKIMSKLNIDYLKFNKFAVSKNEWREIMNKNKLDKYKRIYEDKRISVYRLN